MTHTHYERLRLRYEREARQILAEEAKKIRAFRKKHPNNPLGKSMEAIQKNSEKIHRILS